MHLKSLKRGSYVGSSYPTLSLSYLKPLPTLLLLCLQTSYLVQFDRRHSGFILSARLIFYVLLVCIYYDPYCYYYIYVLLAYTKFSGIDFCMYRYCVNYV